ncbi:MAG: HNH endonuclease [Proteobacteria bacterium]|nr:HNH endonuclease [Pseudomonadota bacterium]
MNDLDFYAPRRCLREPIPEIWVAADRLLSAAEAHGAGDRAAAERLIKEADDYAIAAWTDSLWGAWSADIHRIRVVEGAPPARARAHRPLPRMPTLQTQQDVIRRDGLFCRFCGIPVVDPKTRARIRRLYPDALRWSRIAREQHAAFQAMWLQFDHVLPNSRGGESVCDNIVITCAPCNYGRMEHLLEEVGLADPRTTARSVAWANAARWDGLEGFAR